MNTTAATTRKPVARHTNIRDIGNGIKLLSIQVGNKTQDYHLTRHGDGFHLSKGAEVYSTYIGTLGSSCSCKGHQFTGHCKHQDSLKALIAAGRLASPTQRNPGDEEDEDDGYNLDADYFDEAI